MNKIPIRTIMIVTATLNINGATFKREQKFSTNDLSDLELFDSVEKMKDELDLIQKIEENSIYFVFTHDQLYTPLFTFTEKELIDLYKEKGSKPIYDNLSLTLTNISRDY